MIQKSCENQDFHALDLDTSNKIKNFSSNLKQKRLPDKDFQKREEGETRQRHKLESRNNRNKQYEQKRQFLSLRGPSTITSNIVTFLSQLPHSLHQLPTVGIIGQWPLACILSFCCKSGSNEKTQP
jgi:hypothetical protein